MKNNENFEICSQCNGACCRYQACEVSPRDVFGSNEPTIDIFLDFLSCGKYQIDWWDGDIREVDGIDIDEDDYRSQSFYVRPAHTNSLGRLYDPSWGGTCVFFEDGKGCQLDFDHRPYGGKALVPKSSMSMRCESSYSKKEAAQEWMKYIHLFDTLREYSYYYNDNGTITFEKKSPQ